MTDTNCTICGSALRQYVGLNETDWYCPNCRSGQQEDRPLELERIVPTDYGPVRMISVKDGKCPDCGEPIGSFHICTGWIERPALFEQTIAEIRREIFVVSGIPADAKPRP